MAYYSKYKGAELEERLDKVEEIPQLIAQMITGKDFVTKEDLLCVLKDYAPADYRTIPIDNNTIYWENGVLKAATSEGGQCQWELREHNGIQYLYSRLPVVTQYDVTMYADVNHLDLPNIYDGLPIDGNTIYWEETENGRILKSKYEGSSGVDASEVLSIVSSAGYATQNWVNNQNFISSSLLYTELAKYVKIKDYQEIEGVKNFLNGLQISDIPITKLQEDVLYIDSNVVIRGGLTMYYEDGEINLPSIKDEIGNAGYDGVTGLASFNSSQFSIRNDGTVTIIGGSTGLDTAQLKEYLDSNKYTTETWVKAQGYASASSLSSLQTKVDNFLEGSDTDTIINKWKELEAFLSGLSESDNLATILSTKWTTDNNLINQWNTAYGWGDHSKVGYALKSYVDKTFVTIAGNEDVTGLHNFVNGLKIGGMKLSKSQDGVIYLEGNLVVKGGVTMYALDEVTVDSIIDSLPLASTSQYGIAKFNPSNFVINEDGFVTIIGGSSGLNTEELAEYLATNKYATQGWVEGKGYITSSTLNGYATQSWVTNQKYITGITSAMVVSALGFTPYNSTNFTKANIKSTLGISDWALASSKPSYTTKEVSEDTNLYFTNQRAIDALASTLKSYATDTELSSGLATKADKTINISAGTGLTGGGTLAANRTLSLATSGVSAGTYKSVTVDTYGRVTAGSNPTTLAGYGITDAYTKEQLDNTFALYIPIAGYTDVTGEKNFTGGLKVNGSPIYYDATNKYWKLEGDLLVTGGVTMYGIDEGDLPSILDSLPIASTSSAGIASFDSTYFSVNASGKVTLTSAPSMVSILGSLQDVSPSVSGTTNSDVLLFKSANSSTWTTKPLSEIGGSGGGSVSGNYLPLANAIYHTTTQNPNPNVKYDNWMGMTNQNTPDGANYYHILSSTWDNMYWSSQLAIPTAQSSNMYYRRGASTNAYNSWVKLLDANNYSSYALPLTGGTLSGVLTFSGITEKQPLIKFPLGEVIDTYGNIQMYSTSNVWSVGLNYSALFCVTGTGNVGIGTTSPSQKLHVEGYVRIGENFIASGSIGFNRNTVVGGRFNTSYNGWQFNIATSTSRFEVYTEGTNSGLKAYWDTSGNYLVYGGITMYSDIRKKTKLQDVELSLSQIANAPLIQHYYNSDQEKTTHVGSIAQYWAELNDWFCKLDAEGFYTMEIQNCALASAISIARHLEKYESKTDKKIRQLKKRISQLEDELELLKKGV